MAVICKLCLHSYDAATDARDGGCPICGEASVLDALSTTPYRGTRDFLAQDVHRREHVVSIIRKVYEAHGFEPLETPALERLETLLGKYGEEGDQLVFKVNKRGQALTESLPRAASMDVVPGRSGDTMPAAERILSDVGLRYDLTVPLARVIANRRGKLPQVYRRYQIQPVWRADSPGKGRFREFYQCDVDVVGSKSLLAEAEVCGAVADCLRRLGFADFTIKLNHRALLSAFVEAAGIDPALGGAAIVAVDKLDKVSREDVVAEMVSKGITATAGEKLLSIVFDDPRSVAPEAFVEIDQLMELAKVTPAADHLRFDPTLARGLGYYTGCIFEIAVKDLRGSLGGGGRYDGLVGMFSGQEVPAVGFSIGLERILVVMEERGMFPAKLHGTPQVIVGALDAALLPDALKVAYALRKKGRRVELVPDVAKAGKVRKSADERGVDEVLLVRHDGVNRWLRKEPDVRDTVVDLDAVL